MCCQKTFIMVYLILTNKFLLKTNQIKNILLIISAQERLGVVSKQNGNISVSAKIIKNIGISISAKIQYRASLPIIIFMLWLIWLINILYYININTN